MTSLSPVAAAMRIINRQQSLRSLRRQGGFTLIELGIVIAIIAIIAAVAIPMMNGYILRGKVTPVARDLQEAVSGIRALAAGVASSTPYSGVDTAVLAGFLRESNFGVDGDTVTHTLQASGLAPQSVTISGTSGATFTVQVSGVHEKVCPDFAALMGKVAESITVGSANVKTATTNFNISSARNACVAAGTNISFVFR